MKRTILNVMISLVALFGLTLVPASVGAVNVFQPCDGNADSSLCSSASTDNMTTFIKTVVNTLLLILGAVAVVTIIVSGIRYTTSHGDPGAVKSAQGTLWYSVIGLIVALASYAIVNFVIDQFWK